MNDTVVSEATPSIKNNLNARYHLFLYKKIILTFERLVNVIDLLPVDGLTVTDVGFFG